MSTLHDAIREGASRLSSASDSRIDRLIGALGLQGVDVRLLRENPSPNISGMVTLEDEGVSVALNEDEVATIVETTVATHYPIYDRETVEHLLSLPIMEEGDGRSPWRWLRLGNGDLFCGFYPQGDGYESVVDMESDDYSLAETKDSSGEEEIGVATVTTTVRLKENGIHVEVEP